MVRKKRKTRSTTLKKLLMSIRNLNIQGKEHMIMIKLIKIILSVRDMIHHRQVVIHVIKETDIPGDDMIHQMETYQGQLLQGTETEEKKGQDNVDKGMTLSKTYPSDLTTKLLLGSVS